MYPLPPRFSPSVGIADTYLESGETEPNQQLPRWHLRELCFFLLHKNYSILLPEESRNGMFLAGMATVTSCCVEWC